MLSVVATGTQPLNYQWRKDAMKLSANAFNLGTTNSQLNIYSFNPTNTGDYDVAITNYGGSVTSMVATLTLGTAPLLNQQPMGTNLIVGDTLSLTVGATGPALAYAWYRGTTFLTSSANNVFSKTNIAFADLGDYMVRISNPAATVTSAAPLVFEGIGRS